MIPWSSVQLGPLSVIVTGALTSSLATTDAALVPRCISAVLTTRTSGSNTLNRVVFIVIFWFVFFVQLQPKVVVDVPARQFPARDRVRHHRGIEALSVLVPDALFVL